MRAKLFSALSAMLLVASVSHANLLTNDGFQTPDLMGVEDGAMVPTGWHMNEGTLFTPTANTAQVNHFGVGHGGSTQSIWFRPFEGGNGTSPAFADVYQDVAGSAGAKYELSAWWLFESFYAGGIVGQPTQTIMAIDFLNSGASVISSATLNVRDNGQLSDQDSQTPDAWKQTTFSAVAPAGTVTVRARLSMVDGVSGPGNPQSAFLDDVSLTRVPEPTSAVIAVAALAGLTIRRRR